MSATPYQENGPDYHEDTPALRGKGSGSSACSLRDATIAVLGGVAAISEDLYTDAMEEIAEMSGRENTAEMWQEVNEILQTLPCPID